MKVSSASLLAPVVCMLLSIAGLRVVEADKDRLIVPSGDGFNFFLDRFDDDRTKPYTVTFYSSGFKSTYKLNENGFVTDIKADDETYTISYTDDGVLETVTGSSVRRNLAQEDEDGSVYMPTDPWNTPTPGKRRLYTCEDCELMWESVCDKGVETVCNLEGYGSPLLSAGETSVNVFCNTFGGICEERTASQVCEGECDDGECYAPLTVTLEWSGTGGQEGREEPSLSLYVMESGGGTARPSMTETDLGTLTASAFKNTYTLLSGQDTSSTRGTYIVFAEWWEGFAPISWTLTATDGTGRVLRAEEGQFTGDCGATITSSSTYSNSDQGTSRGTTNLIYVELFEYVDNGC